MEIERLCSSHVVLERMVYSMVETAVLEAALLLTVKSQLCLHLIGSLAENIDLFSNLNEIETSDRLPLADLNTVNKPDAENKDAGEFDDDDEDDDDDDNDDDEDDDDSSEEESDDDDDEGNHQGANGDGGSDDDDDDEDSDDEDDDDDVDDDEEDDDDDEDDELPPSKKNK